MKEETILKRRQEIFDAALKVFSKKGFDRATLDEIADKVKISKPAIYLYFKNKDNLFFSMLENVMNLSNENFNNIIKMDLNSIEKLKKIVSSYMELFIINKDFFKIIHQIKFQLDSEKKSKMHRKVMWKYRDYINKFAKLIKQCMNDGYLTKQDPAFLAFSLIGIMNQSFFRCILNRNFSILKKIDDKIMKLFLKGAGR